MPVVGAKPAPPLFGALQWIGSNRTEFLSFGGSGSTAIINGDGTLAFNTNIGSGVIPVDGWAVTAQPGRGTFPSQVNGNSIQVFTDADFRAQFTTIEDWPTTY